MNKLIIVLLFISFFGWSQNLDRKTTKKAWTALLPSISYSQNSGLNIGFSLSNISNYSQLKRRNEIELQRYQLQLLETSKADSIRTADAHAAIDADLDLLLADIDVLQIYEQLQEIYHGQYSANEISTEEYLQKQISIQRARSSVLLKLKRLHHRAIKLDYPSIKILDSLLLSQDFGSGQRPVSGIKKRPRNLVYKSLFRAFGIASVYRMRFRIADTQIYKLCLTSPKLTV